jgi:hypothetical protein
MRCGRNARSAFYMNRPEFPYIVIKINTPYNGRKWSKICPILPVHYCFKVTVKVRGLQMNNRFRSQSREFKLFLSLWIAFILITGFVFAVTAQPALANNPAQAATGTATVVGTATAGATVSPTAAGSATAVATLPAPVPSGTPTALVPVTGADLTPPGGQSGVLLHIALGLLGLLLIALGFRSYSLSKK